MTQTKRSILIYAYGNPGRQDDGLGNYLVDALQPWLTEQEFDHVETDSNFQLNIEDADNIRNKDVVIFVDASIKDIDDYKLDIVEPSEGRSEFTMHAASPAYILALCKKLYNKHPETYLLQIKGYEWEFKENLSNRAAKNLDTALAFLQKKITSGKFDS